MGDRPRQLLHVFPSFGIGGMEVQSAKIMNGLGAQAHHLIVTLDGHNACCNRLHQDVSREVVDGRVFSRRSLPGRLATIAGFLRERRPDLLLTYNWGAIEWCFVNRWLRIAPGCHSEHGFGFPEARQRLRRREWLRRIALGHDTPLIVPTDALRRHALERWGLASDQIFHIPNGMRADEFAGRARSNAMRSRFAGRDNDVVIGLVAPLRIEKNVARLIRIFSRVSGSIESARLAIIGDGTERARLEALAMELGTMPKVVFTGALGDPSGAFGGIDIFALTSDTEQMPYSILEAMACGLPIVATDVGDIRAIVADENRDFIIPQEDESRFADALNRLLLDPGLRRRLGAANAVKCRDVFNEGEMIARFRQVHACAIEASPGRLSSIGGPRG